MSKNIGGVDLDSVYDEMGFAVNYCNHSNFWDIDGADLSVGWDEVCCFGRVATNFGGKGDILQVYSLWV